MHVFGVRSTSNVIHRTGLAPLDDKCWKKIHLLLVVQLEEDALCVYEASSLLNFMSPLVLLLHSDSEKTMKRFPAPTLVVQSEHTSWRNQAILYLVSHPLFFWQLLQNYIHCSANNWPLWYLRDCVIVLYCFFLLFSVIAVKHFHSLTLFLFLRETLALLQRASR